MQVKAFRRKMHEYAWSTNGGWDFMRSDAAFCTGTQEIVLLYVCHFPFLMGIWCCSHGKNESEHSNISHHVFNLKQTAWRWQWNLWCWINSDFRFSYQISSSEECRWYLMNKIVFIFAVHLSLSNFKVFMQLYT